MRSHAGAWERAKGEATEREMAMKLVVVNDTGVVELCGAQPQCIVGVR